MAAPMACIDVLHEQGSLVAGGQAILTGLPADASPQVESGGLVLGFRSSKGPQSSHDVPLGQVRPSGSAGCGSESLLPSHKLWQAHRSSSHACSSPATGAAQCIACTSMPNPHCSTCQLCTAASPCCSSQCFATTRPRPTAPHLAAIL